MIEKINELERCIPLRELQQLGIVQWTLVRDRDMYLQWDGLVKQGMAKCMAYRNIARAYKCNPRLVMRAVKAMKPL